MIKISHEFPEAYYLNDYAMYNTDYLYCLTHRYLSNPKYREYFKNFKGMVYLDNSLFELRESFSGDAYFNVIKELYPNYYFLPDVFNETESNVESQMRFYNIYGKEIEGKPIAVAHGKTPVEILYSFMFFHMELPEEAMIAIPFGSKAWENEEGNPRYYTAEDIPDINARMASNRGLFVYKYRNILSKRRIHLLGCKGLRELDFYKHSDDMSFIYSIDTSLPVASALEGNSMAVDYKPELLIDEHFMDSPVDNMDLMSENIKKFNEEISEIVHNRSL